MFELISLVLYVCTNSTAVEAFNASLQSHYQGSEILIWIYAENTLLTYLITYAHLALSLVAEKILGS